MFSVGGFKLKSTHSMFSISLYTLSSGHSFTNPLQHSDNSKAELDPPLSRRQLQKSPQHALQEISLLDLRNREASLPHLYESLRGQQLWLSSPKGSCLKVLEEERGAAANCNDLVLNSVGNTHAYAILEANNESARCNFAGPDTVDSLPSLIAPSSLDRGSMEESVAVLNSEANPLPLGPKLEPFSPPKSQSDKLTGDDVARFQKLEDPVPSSQEKSVHESLKPKPATKSWPLQLPVTEALNEVKSGGSSSAATVSLKFSGNSSKDEEVELESNHDRLYPESFAKLSHKEKPSDAMEKK